MQDGIRQKQDSKLAAPTLITDTLEHLLGSMEKPWIEAVSFF